jgi:ActR/RegA family two-component response regulator
MVKKLCSILLVDRDHASATLLAKALKGQGHTVFRARDLAHAVSILEFRAFEVLIIDVNPSDSEELNVINWTATITPRPRIVVTGGAVPAAGEQSILDRGADLYLLKPLDVTTLVDFVARTRSRSSFSGTVEGVDIIEYVQFVMLGGRKTVLEVTSSLGTRGRLFLADGNIIHADCGVLQGEPALYRCLCFKEGNFSHEAWEDPESVTINKPGEFLLMEAIRKRDEAWAGRLD